jgi:hypothetical protein
VDVISASKKVWLFLSESVTNADASSETCVTIRDSMSF